jgi:hypothetical protein
VNVPAFFAITGTVDGTMVTVKASPSGIISAGDGVPAATGGQVIQFPIERGEVVEVVGTPGTDLAGTLVQSTHPVQIISGMPCVNLPFDQSACDHIEESVFPAETLGKRYFVAPPTGPLSSPTRRVNSRRARRPRSTPDSSSTSVS